MKENENSASKIGAIDLHCDTLTKLSRGRDISGLNASVNLEKLKAGGVGVQCFAVWTATAKIPSAVRAAVCDRRYNRLVGSFKDMLKEHPDEFIQIKAVSDIAAARENGKIGALLTVEDAGMFMGYDERLLKAYGDGARVMSLTWNGENAIGYSQDKNAEKMKRGLKPYGFEFIDRLNGLGVIADVSHLSDGGFWDVARRSEKPFIASHSNARAVCEHPRNLSDDMIKTLAEKGGVMGLNFFGAFLDGGKESRVSDMIRHTLHIRNVGGAGILALGSDFDGISGELELSGSDGFPKLWEALKAAGMPERELDGMWGENALRVMREVWK